MRHYILGDAYVPEGAYMNNSCATYLSTSQMTRLDDSGAFIGTHQTKQAGPCHLCQLNLSTSEP